ncbi:MAG TPA: putative O-glycosylation ligase, exosortase A system-associated, partial [Terriglobales bacterium]|nr:putative O-glycosylation ligase, exosortase A system-associated [Terriglobales bacterium]
WTRETIVLLIFTLFMCLTTIFSVYPQLAWQQMSKVSKIILMSYVTLMLMQSKERINLLVWVMTLSLAFYGVKGGIFTIVTGGQFHVRGPELSFISGDNNTALALIMTIPLLRYLQLISPNFWIRNGLTAAMGLSAVAAIGSQSRGALVGIICMASFLWVKSRNKFFTWLLGAAAVIVLVMVMPQQWYDRMATIGNYEQDASAVGRINSWHMAFNLAKDRPLGAGFESFRDEMFAIYAPEAGDVHDSHSIYFQVLGHHGFFGLFLFLLLAVMTWRSASWVIKYGRRNPEYRWAADLCAMIQVSLVGFATTGAFLGVAYFDLYYALIVVVVLCRTLIESQETAVETRPGAGRLAPLLTS